jgi:hypothetical protein
VIEGAPRATGFPQLTFLGTYLSIDTTQRIVTIEGPSKGTRYSWLPLALCSAHPTHTYVQETTGPDSVFTLRLLRMKDSLSRYGAPLMYRHVCDRFLELHRSEANVVKNREGEGRDFYAFTLLLSNE